MWHSLNLILKQLDDLVWGIPTMALILCGGILLK